MEMSPPAGSLIAFAADAGQTAYDGDGSNGLYTEELLKNLRTPGLTIEQVFKRTRAGVVKRSGGGQMPAEYSRLVGDDIYLAGVAETRPQASVPDAPETLRELSQSEILKLAESGQLDAWAKGLREKAKAVGPGDFAVESMAKLLEQVKTDLKSATAPSSRIVEAQTACELIVELLPECLPETHPQWVELNAKSHNRRGDALLVLGKNDEALAAFDTALSFDSQDAYIFYNRARAQLALGNESLAKADFSEAANPRYNQPNAQKLAKSALAELR